jgi:hypothetical protein
MNYFNTFFITLLFLMSFLPQDSIAQNVWPAVTFLQINSTPNENAMAGAFTALPSNSVYAAWYNPAQLGYNPGYSLAIDYSPKSTWLYGSSQLGITNFGTRYHQTSIFKNKIIDWGASIHYNNFDYGKQIQSNEQGNVIGEFTSYDEATSISLGAGFEIVKGFRLSAGYSLRYIESALVPIGTIPGNVSTKSIGSAFTHDFGFISDISWLESFPIFTNYLLFSPFLHTRLAYATKNLGSTVKYSDVDQEDPLPTTIQIGISTSFGFSSQIKGKTIEMIAVHLSREVRDLALTSNPNIRYNADSSIILNKRFVYQPIWGSDINYIENLVQGKNDDLVQVNEGVRFNLFETFEYSYGRYLGGGYDGVFKSNGFAISIKGLKKLVLDDYFPVLKPFSFRYYQSTLKYSDSFTRKAQFSGFELSYTF